MCDLVWDRLKVQWAKSNHPVTPQFFALPDCQGETVDLTRARSYILPETYRLTCQQEWDGGEKLEWMHDGHWHDVTCPDTEGEIVRWRAADGQEVWGTLAGPDGHLWCQVHAPVVPYVSRLHELQKSELTEKLADEFFTWKPEELGKLRGGGVELSDSTRDVVQEAEHQRTFKDPPQQHHDADAPETDKEERDEAPQQKVHIHHWAFWLVLVVITTSLAAVAIYFLLGRNSPPRQIRNTRSKRE